MIAIVTTVIMTSAHHMPGPCWVFPLFPRLFIQQVSTRSHLRCQKSPLTAVSKPAPLFGPSLSRLCFINPSAILDIYLFNYFLDHLYSLERKFLCETETLYYLLLVLQQLVKLNK